VRSGRNTTEEGGDGRMTQHGRVEDLPQAECCETPKAKRPKRGTKTPKNNQKERKVKEKKKKKKKKKQRMWRKETWSRLDHQVNR
jgi:hypothetical protein